VGKDRHTLKAGVEIRRLQMNQGNTEAGTVTYASLAAFDSNQVSTATLNGALPINGLRKTQYYGYIQDEFKWRPNLTLNLGARYSFFNLFHEVQNRANPFDFATCGPQGFCGVGASFGQPNYGDIDPRIAFAWSPDGSGQTVIRAGFGMYHEDGQLDDQNLPISNEVYAYSLSSKTIPALSYPITPFLADTAGIISPRDDDGRRKDTYVTQWGASVKQALPADFVGTISYVGTQGTYLLTLSEVNVVNPLPGVQPYPNFGLVSWRGNKDNSSYQGLSVSLKRSFSRGFLFSPNYMWSHEIDDGSDGSGDGDSLVPQNVACPRCERAQRFLGCSQRLQCQRRVPASFRARQALPESARNRDRHRRQLAIHFHGRSAHRIPGKRSGESFGFPNARRQYQQSAPQSRTRSFAHSAVGAKTSRNG
jgi:hypothetical protein